MFLDKVYAACEVGPDGVDIKNCFAPAGRFQSLGELVRVFSQNFILIAGVILFLLVVISGFNFIRAAGSQDSKAMEGVKTTLTYAVIGFVIIFAAFWLVQLINFATSGSLGNIFQ